MFGKPPHSIMTEKAAAKSPNAPARTPPPPPNLPDDGPSLPLRVKLPPLRATKDADTPTPIPTPKPTSDPAEIWKTYLLTKATVLKSFASHTAAHLATPARAVAKVAAITGFAVACVALWSTLATMDDGHYAVTLAEWTARKDFLEYCEEVRDTSGH